MNLLRYTNGTGHLIMSVVATIAGLIMILVPGDPTVRGTGVSIILAVNAYWFVSGAAKQVATEVVNQMNAPAQASISVPVQPPTQKAVVSLEPVDPEVTPK
jgi:hypothetical protein